MFRVYIIEDEKYGVQEVFLHKEVAEAECETGKYDVSGGGAIVIPWEVDIRDTYES